MADFTASKNEFASEMITLASNILNLLHDLDELNSCYSVHKFDANDTNAFVDNDFSITNNHLTATIVADVMFAIGTLTGAATTGVRNSLRECLVGGLP